VDEVPPAGTADVTEWLWRRRNTRTHLGWSLTGIFVGMIGAAIPLWIADGVGLYNPPTVYPLWLGTFDYLNALFMLAWAVSLIRLGISDEDRYQLRFPRRLRRSKRSDILVPVCYVAGAVLWGALLLHPILVGRATDPLYLTPRPGGTPTTVSALEAGVLTVTIAYYSVLAVVFTIYLVSRRYNPVDLDEYDQMSRRILGARRTPSRS
jgi:hypothetical protein